jgi:uncharacterized protein (TIGR04255 family)
LAPDALTVSTTRYVRWEDFFKTFVPPFQALIELYDPAFITRIGLRYINAIDKRQSGFHQDTPWARLLRSEILGEIAHESFGRSLLVTARQGRYRLTNEQGHVLFQQGLAMLPNRSEPSYMIDFDFVVERHVEVQDAERILDKFHCLAGDAFRWCISEELHSALGPE